MGERFLDRERSRAQGKIEPWAEPLVLARHEALLSPHRKGVTPPAQARVADFVPADSEAFAFLYHPIHEDLSISDWEQPWPHPAPSDPFGRGEPEEVFPARGLKWHDLAEELGLPFGPELGLSALLAAMPARRWPRALVGPEDSGLDRERFSHAMSLFGRHSDGPFFAWYAAPWLEQAEDRLFRFEADHALALMRPALRSKTPSVCFSADPSGGTRAFLASPPGLPLSLLAGKRALIEEFVASKALDALEVSIDARIPR